METPEAPIDAGSRVAAAGARAGDGSLAAANRVGAGARGNNTSTPVGKTGADSSTTPLNKRMKRELNNR